MELFTILLNLVGKREEFVGTVLTWDGVYLLEFGITILDLLLLLLLFIYFYTILASC